MPQTHHIRLRARLPLYVIALLLTLTLLLPNQAWWILLIAFIALLLVSYVWVRLLIEQVSVQRQLRATWVAVGDQLDEWFTLRNRSVLPGIWYEVIDQSNVPGYYAATVRSASPQSEVRWRARAICDRRGRYHIGPWTVRTGDPFGLFEASLVFPEEQEIIIHPPIHSDLPLVLPAGFGQGQVRQQRRTWEATINAGGVRDYQPNDPLHHIHWRKSAQTGSLQVRQFDRDTAGDIWLLLDMDQAVQLGHGKDSTEEHAVLLAASLAAQSLYQERAVGLAAYAANPLLIPPARGEGQRWRMLQGLALISAESHITIAQALDDLSRTVRRGSAVLILTANLDADWIPRLLEFSQRGVALSVALFDRRSFGGQGNPHALSRQLAHIGVPTTILRQGDVGSAPEFKHD